MDTDPSGTTSKMALTRACFPRALFLTGHSWANPHFPSPIGSVTCSQISKGIHALLTPFLHATTLLRRADFGYGENCKGTLLVFLAKRLVTAWRWTRRRLPAHRLRSFGQRRRQAWSHFQCGGGILADETR